MANKVEKPNIKREGHGDESKAPVVKRGTFYQIGSFAEGTFFTTFPKAISPNSKSGTSSGGEQ